MLKLGIHVRGPSMNWNCFSGSPPKWREKFMKSSTAHHSGGSVAATATALIQVGRLAGMKRITAAPMSGKKIIQLRTLSTMAKNMKP